MANIQSLRHLLFFQHNTHCLVHLLTVGIILVNSVFNYEAHNAPAYTFNNSAGAVSAVIKHLSEFLAKFVLHVCRNFYF